MLIVLAALTGYALLGGADFGGGIWDLFAGRHTDENSAARRRLIEHALGPVWEANHVWLIFAVVMLWTGFPSVFAAVASTAYIPLTAAALGIIGRGSAFAFRKVAIERHRRLLSAVFAFSSVVTPFFFGAIIGGIASRRIPIGIAEGGRLASWWNPTSVTTGVLAIALCACLAAVFLTGDALRGAPELLAELRVRAIASLLGFGAVALVGLIVVRADARRFFDELVSPPAVWLVLVSFLAGLASLYLLVVRRFQLVRITTGLGAAAVIWAWGAAQYPEALPGTTIEEAAAGGAVLNALLIVTAVGAVLLAPSLAWLFVVSQRPAVPEPER